MIDNLINEIEQAMLNVLDNEQLSQKRADYIAKLLMDQGVEDSKITAQYRGGISTYVPMEGNRNSCVMLYYKE